MIPKCHLEPCFLLYDNACATSNTISPMTVVVISTFFQFFALSTTLMRYFDMLKNGRLWLDDHLCLAALGLSLVPYVLLNVYVVQESLLLRTVSLTVFTRLGWLTFSAASLWGGRLAVALSIVRFFAPRIFRRAAISVACIFFAIGTTLILHKILVCGTKFNEVPSCPISSLVGYVEVSLDVMGDTWLIGAPFYLVRRTNLIPVHRSLLAATFACAVFTSIASVVHVVYVVRKDVVLIMFTGFIQIMLSIINSNMLILVAFIYRKATSKARKAHQQPTINTTGSSSTLKISFTDLQEMEPYSDSEQSNQPQSATQEILEQPS